MLFRSYRVNGVTIGEELWPGGGQITCSEVPRWLAVEMPDGQKPVLVLEGMRLPLREAVPEVLASELERFISDGGMSATARSVVPSTAPLTSRTWRDKSWPSWSGSAMPCAARTPRRSVACSRVGRVRRAAPRPAGSCGTSRRRRTGC